MGLKRTVTRNVAWNWAGLAVGMISGFVLAPFFVHRLGAAQYGLWILVLSMQSTLLLLDLGVRGAIGRYIALHQARGSGQELATIVKTGQAMLFVAAGCVLLATVGIQAIFHHLFDVSPELATQVRVALVLVGVNVALVLSMGMFDALLWAHERFDVGNAIAISAAILQALASVFLLLNGHFLVALATAMLIVVILRECANAVACWRLGFLISTRDVAISWSAVRCLTGYAIWQFIATLGQRGSTIGIAMVIGSRLTLSRVTQFTVASTLVNYARSFVTTAAGVLTPLSTALHANDRRDQQRRLFLEGCRYSWAFSLLLGSGLIILGESFIVLWMGPALISSAPLLIILALGELLPMSQGIAAAIIRGMNRHRLLAICSVVELGTILSVGLLLAGGENLAHICLGVASCGLVCRGIVPMFYACRLLDMPLRKLVVHALVPPLIVAAPLAGALAVAVHHRPPRTWVEFIAYAVTFSMAYGGACVLGLRRKAAAAPIWTAPAAVESA